MPEFETDDDHTYFISRFYVHEEFAKKAEDSESVNSGNGSVNLENDTLNSGNDTLNPKNDTLNSGNDTLNPKNDTLNLENDTLNLCIKNMQERLSDYNKIKKERAEKIISEMLRNEQVTIEELSQNTGMSVSTLKRYITELKEHEIIVRDGSKKNGRWIILL